MEKRGSNPKYSIVNGKIMEVASDVESKILRIGSLSLPTRKPLKVYVPTETNERWKLQERTEMGSIRNSIKPANPSTLNGSCLYSNVSKNKNRLTIKQALKDGMEKPIIAP